MKAPESSSTPKVLCPRGQHLSRCVQVVDLGSHPFKPGDQASRKIYLGFETSVLNHVFKPENGPEPFMLQSEFAFFMGNASKKTKLRLFLEGWFGRAFPDDKSAAEFDFSQLLGKAAVLTTAHKPKLDGSMKAVIADIFLPEKGTPIPPTINPTVCYEIAHGENAEFRKLPSFLQKKILESEELSRPANHGGTAGTAGTTTPDPSDDMPGCPADDVTGTIEDEARPF